MLALNTNVSSLNTQRSLTNIQESQQSAMERLSSGSRINRGKDDAAGLSISSNMTAVNSSHAQLIRGMNDGISFMLAAEGALNEVQDMLQRSRELAIQALNGTLNTEQRAAINLEFTELKAEIDNIANTKVFNSRPLMSESVSLTHIGDLFPTSGSSHGGNSDINSLAYIPAGSTGIELFVDGLSVDDDIHVFTKDGKHLAGPGIGDATLSTYGITDNASMESNLLTTANGFNASATYDATNLNDGGGSYAHPPTNTTSYNGMSITYTGDDDTNNDGTIDQANKEKLTIDTVTEDLLMFVVGNGSYTSTLDYTYLTPKPESNYGITIPTSSYDLNQVMDIPLTPSDTASLGISTNSLDTEANASATLSALDNAINTVSGHKAMYGAKTNALEHRTQNIHTEMANLDNAISRIKDTNYAIESAELARTNVLQQACMSMLSQANQAPEQIVSLLK